jgi:hypothetical protein
MGQFAAGLYDEMPLCCYEQTRCADKILPWVPTINRLYPYIFTAPVREPSLAANRLITNQLINRFFSNNNYGKALYFNAVTTLATAPMLKIRG